MTGRCRPDLGARALRGFVLGMAGALRILRSLRAARDVLGARGSSVLSRTARGSRRRVRRAVQDADARRASPRTRAGVLGPDRRPDADDDASDPRCSGANLARAGPRSAARPDRAHCRPRKHYDRRAGARRIPRWHLVAAPAHAAGTGRDDSGAPERLVGGRGLSQAGRRAHPAWHRSSAVRAGAAHHHARNVAADQDGDRVHHCAQHHARAGDAGIRQRAVRADRGAHRLEHRIRRRRDRAHAAGTGRTGGAERPGWSHLRSASCTGSALPAR